MTKPCDDLNRRKKSVSLYKSTEESKKAKNLSCLEKRKEAKNTSGEYPMKLEDFEYYSYFWIFTNTLI